MTIAASVAKLGTVVVSSGVALDSKAYVEARLTKAGSGSYTIPCLITNYGSGVVQFTAPETSGAWTANVIGYNPTTGVILDTGTVTVTTATVSTFSTQVDGDTYPRLQILNDGTVVTGDGTSAPVVDYDPIGQYYLPNKDETLPRPCVTSASLAALASQQLGLYHFRARANRTSTAALFLSGSVACAATPTLIRFGLYSIAANGDYTLVASTPNDTTLLSGTFQTYSKNWSTPYAMVKGGYYAMGLLIVSGAAICTSYGNGTMPNATQAPYFVRTIAGQADLPGSIVFGTTSGGTNAYYANC